MTKAFHVSLRSNVLLCIGVSVSRQQVVTAVDQHTCNRQHQGSKATYGLSSPNTISILFVLKEDLGQYPFFPCRQVLIYYVFLTGDILQISRTETFQEISAQISRQKIQLGKATVLASGMKLVDQLSEVPQTQPASKVLWKKKGILAIERFQ